MTIKQSYAHPRLKSRRRPERLTLEALEDRCLLALFVVNSPNDPGMGVCDTTECTLREAILAANASPGPDDIQFNIGSGVVSLLLNNPLPTISGPVNLDATTQPGFVAPGPPIVELNGSLVPAGNGLLINTVSTTIRGLVINRFPGAGIVLQGGGGHTVVGNSVGADLTTAAAAANGGAGILMVGSSANTIGGTVAGDANLIIGNNLDGITIQDGMQNVIHGNLIGITADGKPGLGNGGAGISIQNSSANRVGGALDAERNIIWSNADDGVFVASGAQNQIIGNSIFSNGGLGIDLGVDGPNFPQDPDPGAGANDSQNFPILTGATVTSIGTLVQGTLNSSPSQNFTLAFYASSDADPLGFGEGQQFLGRLTVTTSPAGFALFNDSLPIAAPAGSVITATATNSSASTSEFSQAIPVVVPLLDLNVRAFVTAAAGPAALLEIQYSVVGAPAPALEFAFFASADARFDNADAERPPRLQVTSPADLAVGAHTIRFSGAPYAPILNSLDIPFVVTRGQIVDAAGTALAESDSTNNDINFVGLFHEPGLPLVIRGKDNTDLYVDNPDDTIFITGGATTTVMADFLAGPIMIATSAITEIRALGLGGDDSIRAAADVALRLFLRGGSGDDLIVGGLAADELSGESGDDVLAGGLGNDALIGGPGSDTADFSVDPHGVVASLVTGTAKGQGRDTLITIENLTGSAGRDRLTGNAGANVLFGGAGPDLIVGGAGPDLIGGGDGNDSIFGEAGADELDGDAGNDSICGGTGADIITGGAGADHLEGGDGNDELRGGAGADFICGGVGDDSLAGNAGNDSLVGEAGIDRLLGGADFDFILFDAADLLVDLGGAGPNGGKAIRSR
jgi:CSLREA domain-containing protein